MKNNRKVIYSKVKGNPLEIVIPSTKRQEKNYKIPHLRPLYCYNIKTVNLSPNIPLQKVQTEHRLSPNHFLHNTDNSNRFSLGLKDLYLNRKRNPLIEKYKRFKEGAFTARPATQQKHAFSPSLSSVQIRTIYPNTL